MDTIIMTIVVFSGISAVLAAILTISDRTVNNYGDVTLTINEDKNYTVKGGTSLLDTLRNEKFSYPQPVEVKEPAATARLWSWKEEALSLQRKSLFLPRRNWIIIPGCPANAR